MLGESSFGPPYERRVRRRDDDGQFIQATDEPLTDAISPVLYADTWEDSDQSDHRTAQASTESAHPVSNFRSQLTQYAV